jgi:cobyrinic acid a,c-diamide synthase
MLENSPRLVIAAPHSGSGKTTFTMGLLLALRHRAFSVQPFKIGPDFIDPSYHTKICQRASRNLDSWMCDNGVVKEIFTRAVAGADISVIEGVMGLFDGYGPTEERGSTAHVAKLLDAPVVLVIDAQRAATSAAAVALGFQQFDTAVNIVGVVFNNVGGKGHYDWLKQVLETRTKLKAFGFLNFDPALKMEERHLGLVPAAERAPEPRLYAQLLHQFKENIDLDGIITAARFASKLPKTETNVFPSTKRRSVLRIGVARDEALNFYYQENLDLLSCLGAEIVPFSLLNDNELPPRVQGIYLGGGFPEVFSARLSSNHAMKASIRDFHSAGGVIYAECGGLMVLCEALVDFEGHRHEMIGLVPAVSVMRRDKLSLGYVEVETLKPTVIADVGENYRAQTFHYSVLEDVRFEPALKVYHGANVSYDGYVNRNLFATYIHAHFAARPMLAHRFIERCRAGIAVH